VTSVLASASDPVVLQQVLPPWTGAFAGAMFDKEFRGAIEVDIDERGQVVSAEITQAVHPLYDPLLLQAAREWKYEPARATASRSGSASV
jgi:hypothetical protein